MPSTGAPLLSPFGLGTPATADVPPSGAPKLSRYINPGSGDYEINSDTRHLRSMPSIRQRVMIAVRTLRGSSIVLPDLGISLPEKMDDRFESRVSDSVRMALRQLTDVERLIRLDSVQVQRKPIGRVRVVVSYTVIDVDAPDQIDTTF